MPDGSVVITGVGIIGPLGCTAGEFAHGWRGGRCAEQVRLPELAGTPLAHSPVAALPAFDPALRLGGRRMLKFMSDAAVLGCLAAREALQEAQALQRFPPHRIGLYAGTGLAAANVNDVRAVVDASIDAAGEFSCRLLGERGLAAANPLLSFKILANMPPCLISVSEGIRGPNLIFTPWEGQTGAAIAEGWRAVATGEVACALVGAADTAASASTFVYLRQAGLLGPEEFPASGAGYLVLERTETAQRDGVPIRARIRNMRLQPCAHISDPLGPRLGRTFAAAPALLMGLAALGAMDDFSICGVDRQELHVELEAAS